TSFTRLSDAIAAFLARRAGRNRCAVEVGIDASTSRVAAWTVGPIVADLHSLDYPVAAIATFDSGYWATPSHIELAVRIAAINGGFAPVSIVARLAPFFDPVAAQITTSARSFAAVAVVDAL